MGEKGLKRPKFGSGEVLVVLSPPGAHWGLAGPQNKSQRPGPEKKRGDLGESDPGGALDVWVLVFGGRGGVPVPPQSHRVPSFPQGCPRWRRPSTMGGCPRHRGPWVLPCGSALGTSWRSPWPRPSSSGGRWGPSGDGVTMAGPQWPWQDRPQRWGQTPKVGTVPTMANSGEGPPGGAGAAPQVRAGPTW